MRILIEEYQYNYEDVANVLKGLGVLQDVEGKVSLSYVGYYFNPDPDVNDCVFILPKVLLEGEFGREKVFGHIDPKDLIDADNCKELTSQEQKFIYELSVWIYRAICVFKDHEYDRMGGKKNVPSIVLHKQAPMMGNTHKKRKATTFLDVLLALQKWNRDNESYVMFIVKNLHSGYNKINWTRTISKSQAVIQQANGSYRQDVSYLNPVNKKRTINFDEELLVIYFSILQYIHHTYGFPVKMNVNFELIGEKQFKRYLNGFGKRRLKQIKYKYFSDKAKELWELCFAFFDRPENVALNVDQREYLLVKSFHIVFEAIIDELIGDKNLPQDLKDQPDGKRVDHMYQYQELTNNETDDTIYYIGDSKYYKRGNTLKKESVYKQFTYARNVIQWNIDLFNDGTAEEQKGHVKLRDEETEGYNIIPNFFISANQNVLRSVDQIQLIDNDKPEAKRRQQYYLSRQYENRLFDRDTFLLAHYDVNFLFVVALYGRNNRASKEAWRNKVRKMFRTEIQEMLKEKFLFYALTPHENVDADKYIRENFQLMLGKLFKPFEDVDGQSYFSLALRNPEAMTKTEEQELRRQIETENEGVRQVIDQYFYRAACDLGTNPVTLADLPKVVPTPVEYVPEEFRTRYFFEAFMQSNFLVGCYKDAEHLKWIFGRTGKRDNMYNIRINKERDGSVLKSRAKKAPDFLFLYNVEEPTTEGLMMFKIHNAADTPYEFMKRTGYPGLQEGRNYVSYILEQDPITFGEIDIKSLISDYKLSHETYKKGEPIFMLGKELIRYRKNPVR